MEYNEKRNWNGLFKMGALSAIIIVLVYLAELVVIVFYGLPPSTAAGWFALLQRNRLTGLIQTFALDVIAVTFHAPLYVAFFFLLKRNAKSYSTLILAVVFAWIGIAVYFASSTTFSMLYLSDQFASATTEVQRSQILTSGQTLIAVFNGTGPFIAYFLYAVSGILVSIVMLQTHIFSKVVAIAGLVGNVLELGLPPSIDPAFFLKIDPFLIGIGGVVLLFWYLAIAVKFYRESYGKES